MSLASVQRELPVTEPESPNYERMLVQECGEKCYSHSSALSNFAQPNLHYRHRSATYQYWDLPCM